MYRGTEVHFGNELYFHDSNSHTFFLFVFSKESLNTSYACYAYLTLFLFIPFASNLLLDHLLLQLIIQLRS